MIRVHLGARPDPASDGGSPAAAGGGTYDIVFLTDQLGRGGAETQLVRIAMSLRKRGWRVAILSLFPGSDFEEELFAVGIPHRYCESVRMPENRPLIPLRITLRLIRTLRAWRPATLICFSYHSDVMGRVCGRLAGVPVIIGSLRTAFAKTSLRERVYRITEPLINLTVANSQAGINYMISRRALTPRKTLVIPNGMFTSEFPSSAPREEVRAELGIAPGAFLWIAVGTLNKAKDYPTMLDAAAKCAAADPRFRLSIAGGGEALAALQAEAAARGLEEVVHFLGKRTDVARLLKAADAFVLSSAWEGLPNAVMEALASGLPVVATDVGGIRDLVEPGRSGWIVPPQNPDALAEQMLGAMALNPPTLQHMGAHGRERMISRFDQERIADRWESLLLQSSATARNLPTKQAPAFVISLDFELLWGMRDKRTIDSYGANILGEREAVPAMLKLFGKYGVKATWAAVGMTLFETRKDLLRHLPDMLPTYDREDLNPYRTLDLIGDDERSDPYHFGISMARQILDCEGMELGSHTFSHFYCLEKGQTEAQFRADLEASIAAVQRLTQRPVSFVFPRNQYNPQYLPVCAETGFTCFRGNERAWMYNEAPDEGQRLPLRATRLLDHYLNLSGSNGFIPFEEGGLINCPSSRFLRPASPYLGGGLDRLRMRRIKRAMEATAKAGQCFHLWWHPHNFGTQLRENLANLEELLRFHVTLRERYGVVPLTMGEISARARAGRPSRLASPPSEAPVGGGR
ncbi:glycosyltransferase [Geothrix campi]|uniref:glycosyltransferase n=1 Tax=Geothrix campi TaxID=2966450 RepID=UPI0021473AC3|nr:glycosyltransferase [Geothrix sp. SG10]